MLEAFFGAALCVPEFIHRRLRIRHDTLFNDCVERNSQVHPCMHVRYLKRDVGASIESWKWNAFVAFPPTFCWLSFALPSLRWGIVLIERSHFTSTPR